jgi:hypothetical protein
VKTRIARVLILLFLSHPPHYFFRLPYSTARHVRPWSRRTRQPTSLPPQSPEQELAHEREERPIRQAPGDSGQNQRRPARSEVGRPIPAVGGGVQRATAMGRDRCAVTGRDGAVRPGAGEDCGDLEDPDGNGRSPASARSGRKRAPLWARKRGHPPQLRRRTDRRSSSSTGEPTSLLLRNRQVAFNQYKLLKKLLKSNHQPPPQLQVKKHSSSQPVSISIKHESLLGALPPPASSGLDTCQSPF